MIKIKPFDVGHYPTIDFENATIQELIEALREQEKIVKRSEDRVVAVSEELQLVSEESRYEKDIAGKLKSTLLDMIKDDRESVHGLATATRLGWSWTDGSVPPITQWFCIDPLMVAKKMKEMK